MPVYLEVIESEPTTADPSFSDYDIVKVQNESGAWMVYHGTFVYSAAGTGFGLNMQQLGSQVHHVTQALFDFLTDPEETLHFLTSGGP